MSKMADLLKQLERDIAARGVSTRRVLKEAGVNPSTWTRWKAGRNSPNLSTLERCHSAVRAFPLLPDGRTDHVDTEARPVLGQEVTP